VHAGFAAAAAQGRGALCLDHGVQVPGMAGLR
jgi:hypothetical protein